MPLTRRSLLVISALTVAGCSSHGPHARPQPPVVPDADALEVASRIEQAVISGYRAKIAQAGVHARARLEVERAIHVTHLSALRSAAQGTTTGPAPLVPTDIRHALRHSVHELRGLALGAAVGANASLLASIAASHQVSSL